MLLSALVLSAAAPAVPHTAAQNKSVEIAPGVFMPKISLGTCCGSDPTVGLEPWLAACGADVCGIDTAWDYKDQPAIGSLLKAQKTKRESIFITTKVPPSAALCDATKGAAATLANIQLDVKQLGVEFVDLVLLHGPCKSAAQINAMWSGAEQALKSGIVKSIGVSNFNAAQLAEIKGTKPAANQCYMTMGKHDQATIEYCIKNGITYEAYDAMKGCPFTNPKVAAIAKAHSKSVAQVCLRWIVDSKCVMAVGTGSNATTAGPYAKENYDIFDFELTPAEMKILNAI